MFSPLWFIESVEWASSILIETGNPAARVLAQGGSSLKTTSLVKRLSTAVRSAASGVGAPMLPQGRFAEAGDHRDAAVICWGLAGGLHKPRCAHGIAIKVVVPLLSWVRAGLRNARAKGQRLGRPRVVVDASKVASLRAQGRSWSEITAEMRIGKGTAQRALGGLPTIG
jgi:hypothetical protein